jgi:hypothetical protein
MKRPLKVPEADVLPREWQKSNYLFKFLRRIGDWHLYSKQRPGQKESFEVVKPYWQRVGGPNTEHGWTYPPNTQWGACGFTYTSRDAANEGLRDAQRVADEIAVLRERRGLSND